MEVRRKTCGAVWVIKGSIAVSDVAEKGLQWPVLREMND